MSAGYDIANGSSDMNEHLSNHLHDSVVDYTILASCPYQKVGVKFAGLQSGWSNVQRFRHADRRYHMFPVIEEARRDARG